MSLFYNAYFPVSFGLAGRCTCNQLNRVEEMPRSKKNRGALVKNRNAYLLIAPNIFFLVLFLIAPFVWVLVLSFQKGSILGPKTFVGLTNYLDLFRNKLLLKSILNTLKYTVTVIPSVFVVGMIVALLLNRIKKLRNFFRTMLFIPLLSSIVVAAIIWKEKKLY